MDEDESAGKKGMSRAIILAAGLGTRLADGRELPKPLRQVAGVPLIVRVIRALAEGGVGEVGVVVGHLGEMLVDRLSAEDLGLTLSFIQNDEFRKPNGTSLLKAAGFVTGPTYVLMSDHLWAPSLLGAVESFPLASDEAVLGVDTRIETCFDLDDATKVQVEGDRITRIGKELENYNALDTGVFRITPAFIEALQDAEGPDGCTLSEGVTKMIALGKMRAANVGDATWIDVDTPEAHAEAERLIAAYGDKLEH